MCRDYCKEVWVEVLNRAGVPTTSKWRSTENIFYPKDIREVSAILPPPAALALPPPKQPSTIQAPSLDTEVSIRTDKTNDQDQETEAAKVKKVVKGGPYPGDKGRGKEVQSPTKAKHSENALTIKDVVSKAKDAESKPKTGNAKSKSADPKEDPPQTKA